MIKCCENCRYVIFDNVPYGSTSTIYISGCQCEDNRDTVRSVDDGVCDLWVECYPDEYPMYESEVEK